MYKALDTGRGMNQAPACRKAGGLIQPGRRCGGYSLAEAGKGCGAASGAARNGAPTAMAASVTMVAVVVVTAVVLILVPVAMVAAVVPVMVQINMMASWTTSRAGCQPCRCDLQA